MSFPQDTTGGVADVPPVVFPSDSPAPVQPSTLPSSSSREPTEATRALFNAAIDLLSRREHSCQELRRKLSEKHPQADFDSVLLRLQDLNYQSDQRFAEVFCRSRVQRGQGPLRIRLELQQRGISGALTQASLDRLQSEVDWYQLALEQLQRKFRRPVDPALPRDQQLKERARRQRHLAYRGFFGDAIQFAITELDAGLDTGLDTESATNSNLEGGATFE